MKSQGNSPSAMNVGTNIRKLRMLKDWKQEVLASKLGITKVAISNIERGTVNLQLSRLCEIAQVFEVDVTVLVQKVTLNFVVDNRF